MGHTLTEWQAKVAALVRDAGNADFSAAQIATVGIAPALAQFSVDRPLVRWAEIAGAASPYLALPTGWNPGFSAVASIECPARANPPRMLDRFAVALVRSPTDVTVEQLLVDVTPAVGTFVRLSFTARWPVPTATAADDLVDDIHYEAVAALAASFCCTTMVGEASRSQHASLPTDWTDSRSRAAELLESAKAYRATYDRILGVRTGTGTSAPIMWS